MNQLKTILLFGVLAALFIGIGGALAPDALGVFVVVALVMNLGAYFFSDKLVLAMYRARQVSRAEAPELHAMIEELSAAAGIPKPRVFVVPSRQPNAFATGRNPRRGVVAVTEGITDMLDRRELRGCRATWRTRASRSAATTTSTRSTRSTTTPTRASSSTREEEEKVPVAARAATNAYDVVCKAIDKFGDFCNHEEHEHHHDDRLAQARRGARTSARIGRWTTAHHDDGR